MKRRKSGKKTPTAACSTLCINLEFSWRSLDFIVTYEGHVYKQFFKYLTDTTIR